MRGFLAMDEPKYLKHPENGRVLSWTQILADRGDMIPCDADGNPLSEDCINPDAEPFNIPNAHSVVGSSGLGDPENREQLGKMLDDELKERMADGLPRKSLPYDGVMGILSEWVPERDQNRFYDARNLLLNNYRHDQVLELLDLWPRYIKDKLDIQQHINKKLDHKEEVEDLVIKKIRKVDDSPFTQMHRELEQAIDFMFLIKQATDAGPMQGIKMLAGDHAARGYKTVSSASGGGKAKGENASQEKERVRDAAKQIFEGRTRKPGQRELARLVVSKLYSDLTGDEAEKKADAVRQWLK